MWYCFAEINKCIPSALSRSTETVTASDKLQPHIGHGSSNKDSMNVVMSPSSSSHHSRNSTRKTSMQSSRDPKVVLPERPSRMSLPSTFGTSTREDSSTPLMQSNLSTSHFPFNIRMVCCHLFRDKSTASKFCQSCFSEGQFWFEYWKGDMFVWQPVRPSPPYTRPYELCRHHSAGRPCVVGEKCKFAHGKEELFVWNTLKDEGW